MHSLQAVQPETKEPILEIAKPLTRNWQFEGKQFYLDIRYTDTRSMSCKRCRFTIYLLHHHPPIILYMAHCSRFSAILEVCQFIWFFIHPLGTQLSPTLNSSWIKRHRINKYRKIENPPNRVHQRQATALEWQADRKSRRIEPGLNRSSSRTQSQLIHWPSHNKRVLLGKALHITWIPSQRNGYRKFITLLFLPITRGVKDTLYSFV